ncbi:MAG: hypothetical protein U1F56_15915 [Rubrivivax sp.]
MSEPARIDLRRCLVQSLLMSAMQVVMFQPGYLVYMSTQDPRLVPLQVLVLMASFFAFAMAMAASAQWVEGRWSWPAIVALGLAHVAVLALLQRPANAAVHVWLGLPTLRLSPWFAAWIAIASAPPFFAYCLIVQRSVRVQAVLGRAEFERTRTAALVGQARADALEGRVDPALLQRALVALQAAYAGRRMQAEALLDALVDFLRQAMPAIRSGRSTLMDELTLLRRYAALVHLVDGGRNLCQVSAEAPPRDPAFAPLLLIPLVEALSAAQGRRSPVRVDLSVQGACATLAFDVAAPGPGLDERWSERLERALRAAPEPAGARFEVGGARALTLWLPLQPLPEETLHEPRPQPAP